MRSSLMSHDFSQYLQAINLSAPTHEAFSFIKHKTAAMLLDSGSSSHENSRFDLILSEPLAILKNQNGKNVLTEFKAGKKQETTLFGDTFALAEQVWQQYKPSFFDAWLAQLSDVQLEALPFLGGIAGWWSYDLARQIESLPTQAQQDFSCPDLYLAIYDFALIKDNVTNTWYQLDFQPHLARLKPLLKKLKAPQVDSPASDFKLTSNWQSNMEKDDYQAKFNQVKDYLLAGDCYQINLAQRFSAAYEGDEWQAYLKLTKDNQAPFSAYINADENKVVSISPERFLLLDNNKIETKPIKGTLPRGKTQAADESLKKQLQHAEKDRAENLMIVDLLRNDISKSAKFGTVKVPKLFNIESFPAVHHLVSTVVGEIADNTNAFDLLKGAFPGGSITGAPKVRAMEIIETLEPHRRHIYCGSIGFIDWRNRMDTNIAIRTLVTAKQHIYCWAGGGLVFDSELESEYQETFDKVAKILPSLS